MSTVLAIGAHYDDCVFGVPGVLLRAVRKDCRVIAVNLIGDYERWAPVRGRARELCETSARLARERGVEMRFLGGRSMAIDGGDGVRRELAEIVAEVRPDVALALWHRDRHPDHGVASALSEDALRQPGAILGRDGVRPPGRIYYYDNGPGHTVGFEPDTHVDVSAEWASIAEWLGRLMAFVRGRPYDPAVSDGALAVKEGLARYRGMSCGVRYAEALRAGGAYPLEIV